jgi:diguanylate cyclase (GGDEF)-like protein
MISLKKYLDLDPSALKEYRQPEPSELLAAALLEAYRAMLAVVGSCGRHASATLDFGLEKNLLRLKESLPDNCTPATVREVEARVEARLWRWSDDTGGYMRQKADEVKEIVRVLVRATESATKRNQRYENRFTEITARLESIANLDDLGQLRVLLTESVTTLKTCAEEMNQEGRNSVEELQAEIATYQEKLEKTEALALRDSLTGLLNRRAIEEQLERRAARNRPFSVLMIDLDGFKQVNDRHGHAAGDGLLVQFAAELRAQSRSSDAVGRWGGDEFLVVLEGSEPEAQSFVERVRQWVFGTYTVQTDTGACKVKMSASLGVAAWRTGDASLKVVERADADMYARKRAARDCARNEVSATA